LLNPSHSGSSASGPPLPSQPPEVPHRSSWNCSSASSPYWKHNHPLQDVQNRTKMRTTRNRKSFI
jgi:hypothetical protein